MPWDFVVFHAARGHLRVCAGGVVAVEQSGPLRRSSWCICFFNVAGIFVMLGAEFLAVVQVIVYTGAILVLLLFVLMLVDPDDLPEFHSGQPVQRTVGVLLGVILLLEVAVAILDRTVKGVAEQCDPGEYRARRRQHAGARPSLYTEYLLPFEIVSLVLTVGVIGAIVLAMPERLGQRVRRARHDLARPSARDRPRAAGGTAWRKPNSRFGSRAGNRSTVAPRGDHGRQCPEITRPLVGGRR